MYVLYQTVTAFLQHHSVQTTTATTCSPMHSFGSLALDATAWSCTRTQPMNRKWAAGPAKVTDWPPRLTARQVFGQISEEILMCFACMRSAKPSAQEPSLDGGREAKKKQKKL